MGSNADGRLGIGDTTVKLVSAPCLVEDLSWGRASEIACGWGHTAVVLEDGKVFTWGVGEYGALGTEDTLTQWRPTQVSFKGETGVFIKQVSCGTRHTAFVDSRGRLFMCGAGDAGQLGIGSRECKPYPVHVTSITQTVVSSSCGIFHTLILTSDKTVLGMGGNNFGQLGNGNKRSSSHPIAVKGLENERIINIAAGHISAAVTDKGVVYVWGTGVFGEYLLPTQLKGIKKSIRKVEIGGNFGTAIDYNGALYTWGSNANGELGLGDYEPKSQGCQVNSMQGKCVEDISCGGSYAIALGRTVHHKYIPTSRSRVKDKERPKEKYELEKELEMQLKESKKESSASRTIISSGPKQRQEYRETAPTRKYEEVKQRIPSPPRVENQYDEMLEAYKREQQRCRDLRKRITELQKQNQDIESRVRENSFRDNNQRFQSRLISVESQLASEQSKCANLLREFEEKKVRGTSLDPELTNLENRANDLEIAIKKLRQENTQIQSNQGPSENLKVSALLKDYEDRIEQEIEDRRRLTKEKANEVRTLQDEVGRNENIITRLQAEKTRLSDSYMDEIKRLEAHADEQKLLLDGKIREKEELLELKKQDNVNIDLIEDNIAKVNDKISELQIHLKNLSNELEQVKRNLMDLEEDLAKSKEENEQCQGFIFNKETEYSNTTTAGKDSDAKNIEELKKLQELLDEKSKFNKELQEILLARIVEIEGLNKDVNSWMDIANKARVENTDLKKIIEDLEGKNKKLMESMNLHIYNRAAEYKERTIRALKATQSPERIDKLRSSGYKLRHVTPSPERFEKFMEEEKKCTSKGVDSVIQLTQFKADTIESIKNKRQGLRKDLITPERKRMFDGKFVVDQVDNDISEDPNFVKSNYVLVQMLDKYGNSGVKQGSIKEEKIIYTTPGATKQIIRSSQHISPSRIKATPEIYATPDEANLKGIVKIFVINRDLQQRVDHYTQHQQCLCLW